VIYDLSDVDLVERSKYDMSFKYFLNMAPEEAVYQIKESMKEKFPANNTTNDMADELDYCREIISVMEREPQISQIPAVKEKVNLLKNCIILRSIWNADSSSYQVILGKYQEDSKASK